jgi:hypothetical protein
MRNATDLPEPEIPVIKTTLSERILGGALLNGCGLALHELSQGIDTSQF